MRVNELILSRDGAAAARRPHKSKVVGSSPTPATDSIFIRLWLWTQRRKS